jgi:hypothetical protein
MFPVSETYFMKLPNNDNDTEWPTKSIDKWNRDWAG